MDDKATDKVLAPCPFCGGTNIELDGERAIDWQGWVHCGTCSFSGPPVFDAKTREEANQRAAELWNTRVRLSDKEGR